MDRGRHEPSNFDEYFTWHENNCEKCLRYLEDRHSGTAYTTLKGSCEWSETYTDHAFGEDRPSDEIITSMFNLPHCSGLERSDLQGDQK